MLSKLIRHVPRQPLTRSFGSAQLNRFTVPLAKNEPMLNFAPGSIEREQLKKAIEKMKSEVVDVPIVIGGKEYRTSRTGEQRNPSNHNQVLAKFSMVDDELAQKAVDTAMAAKKQWEETPAETRAGVLLRAADLLATKYRYEVIAATMLGQGKNTWQAEIDSAAELIDFWRFGVKYMHELYANQPVDHSPTNWNRIEYRPLEGFIYAISPFNFTAIGGNLTAAPALMGNTIVWKPSNTSILSSYLVFKIMEEAGMPPGVINFVPEHGPLLSKYALGSQHLGGIHFTGSTNVFQHLWKTVGNNIENYRSYPRLVGETGGKNFHMVHPSGDKLSVVNQTIRSAFEYSGQKCSACSRLYVPASWWNAQDEQPNTTQQDPLTKTKINFKRELINRTQNIIDNHMGQPEDSATLVAAVIDEASFKRLSAAIQRVKQDGPSKAEIIVGGKTDSSKGWFVQPTIVVVKDPHYYTMVTELFGPILTVFVYEDADYEKTLELVDSSTKYALTGSIFAQDLYAQRKGYDGLRNASGMFYVNDKSTGAVVGQQPFGGARGSGTNDKAGGMLNLIRWVSPRTIKETFVPLVDWKYPSNAPDAVKRS